MIDANYANQLCENACLGHHDSVVRIQLATQLPDAVRDLGQHDPDAWRAAVVLMHHEPYSGLRDWRRRRKSDEVRLGIGAEAGETTESSAMNRSLDCRFVAAGLHCYAGARRLDGEPIGLIDVLDIRHLHDEMVSETSLVEVRASMPLEIGVAGIKSEGHGSNAPDDEVVLFRLS